MPDLSSLPPLLAEDLEKVSRNTGIPLKTLERARAAWELAGCVGLQALGPVRSTPALEAFHLERIRQWLDRELKSLDLEVHARRNRYTLQVHGRDSFQLRFVPDSCAWLLFERRQGSWWPYPSSRPCISLTDWLGQLRRRLTLGPKSR
jgi:hypothetical protein